MNDTLQLTHQMFEAADALRLRLVLSRETGLLFRQRVIRGDETGLVCRQRLVLGAKRLQRRKRLLSGSALFGRQRSEVDLCKRQHGRSIAQRRVAKRPDQGG